MARGIFAKVANAQANQGGNNIKDGKGRLAIQKMICKQMNEGWTFVAEMKVLSSAATEQGIEPNPVGSTVSYVQKLDKHKSALGNTKSFVLALLGFSDSEVSSDEFAETLEDLCRETDEKVGNEVKPANPGRGMVIDFETFRKPKRDKPTEILVLPRWTHVKQTAEEIAKVSASLGAQAE